jgi:hypothetical protein
MNFTSAGDSGGRVARVDDGSLCVGWPGAPGWTTTGVAGSACCAQTVIDNTLKSMPAASNTLRHAEIFMTNLRLALSFFDVKMIKGGFNFQVQEWNWFSLQRSEMFIAKTAPQKDLAPKERNPATMKDQPAKRLRSYGAKEQIKRSIRL